MQDTWRVRILDGGGTVRGAGVLVSREHVLTCAHVVADALGQDPGGPAPSDHVVVDFPGCRSAQTWPARPLGAAWAPLEARRGDFAVLLLGRTPPADAEPAMLRLAGPSYDRPVRTYGHPGPHAFGVWEEARLRGAGGPDPQWIEMAGGAIGKGFSGAGVKIDDGSVVGLVIALDSDAAAKRAWMMPVEAMPEYWPDITGMLGRRLWHRVTEESRQMLAGLLVRVRAIRDPRTRETHIDLLRHRYPGLVRNRRNDPLADAQSIVDACLEEPGALHELVGKIKSIPGDERDEIALAQLRQVMAEVVPVPLLIREERDALLRMLDSVPATDIAECHRATMAPLSRVTLSAPVQLMTRIADLEDGNFGPGGAPPLIDFVERVAARSAVSQAGPARPGRAPAGDLRSWTDDVAARLSIPPGRIAQLRQSHSAALAAMPRPTYFVTRLQPHSLHADRYLITVWLQHGSDPGLTVRREESAHSLEDARWLVDAAFAEAPRLATERVGPVTAEFVLPRRLLREPVDQWRIGLATFPHWIGIDHAVVVRLLGRPSGFRDSWRQNTAWLRANGHEAHADDLVFVPVPGAIPLHSLYASFTRDGPQVGMALSFPPSNRDDAPDEISAAVEGGAPIMLWCRSYLPGAEREGALRALLSGQSMNQLPELIRQQRVEAAAAGADGTHLGHGLVLVWDPHDRFPEPHDRYVAPRWPQEEP